MGKDALSRLRSPIGGTQGQASKRLRAAAPSRQQGSRFLQCPLCGKAFHSSLLQGHVDQCLASAGEGAGLSSVSPPSRETIQDERVGMQNREACVVLDATAAAESRQREGSSFVPIHDKHENTNLVENATAAEAAAAVTTREGAHIRARQQHVPRPDIAEGPTAVPPSLGHPRQSPGSPPQTHGGSNPDGPRESTTPPEAGAAKACTGKRSASAHGASTPKRNAFSTMMAASALADFREEMYLWAHEDGTLSLGWGPAGSPQPPPPGSASSSTTAAASGHCKERRRWSHQVATKGPDGSKAGTLELWTNLPSAVFVPAAALERGDGDTAVEGAEAWDAGSSGNAGVKAVCPTRSLSQLPMAVVKSMLQKNIRRGRAEASVRCALELALKSWSDAIRRVLVIVVEDSLLHPAAPLLSWLMAATSKGYRPPLRLLEAFLCIVYETAACPIRDSNDSCFLRDRETGVPISLDGDDFPSPHPRDALPPHGSWGHARSPAPVSTQRRDGVTAQAVGQEGQDDRGDARGSLGGQDQENSSNAAVACFRRALILRMSYGGLTGDQALLKGAYLAWGERCGHWIPQHLPDFGQVTGMATSSPPPARDIPPSSGNAQPFCYLHASVLSALAANPWVAFLLAAHAGTGMPKSLRLLLMRHIVGGPDGAPDVHREQSANESRKASWNLVGGLLTQEQQEKQQVQGAERDSARDRHIPPAVAGPSPAESELGPLLREDDAILSGVDYHCSKVLDDLLRSTSMAAKVGAAIQAAVRDRDSRESSDATQPNPRVVLSVRRAAKQAMWACSGGLNERTARIAFGSDESGDPWQGKLAANSEADVEISSDDAVMSRINTKVWDALSPSVVEWTRRFVRPRLALGATQ